MNTFSKIIVKFRFLFFLMRVFCTSEYGRAKLYSKYYGVKMGKNVRITGVLFFPTEAYLIEIGNDVTLTQNITFHTHDGGVGVLRKELKGINLFGKIKIGNNVFIGSNTTILPNITIGDNVVIGSNSVVTKNISHNVVVAGNPAKNLKTFEEYKQKAMEHGIFLLETNPRKRKLQIIKAISEKENQIP